MEGPIAVSVALHHIGYAQGKRPIKSAVFASRRQLETSTQKLEYRVLTRRGRGPYIAPTRAPTLRRDDAPPKLLTDSGGRHSDQTRRVKLRRPSGFRKG